MAKKKLNTGYSKAVQLKIDALNNCGIHRCHKDISFHEGILQIKLQCVRGMNAVKEEGAKAPDLINVAVKLHQHYQGVVPSRENAIVITKLQEARMWAEKSPIQDIADLEMHKNLGDIHDCIKIDGAYLTIIFQVGHPNEEGSLKGCFSTHFLEAIIAYQKNNRKSWKPISGSLEQSVIRLEEALMWLEERARDRKERGVLQTDKE